MSLPFDLEDVVGVAVADLLRRVGLIAGVVLGSGFLVAFGYGFSEALLHLRPSALWESLGEGLILTVRPLATGWAVLYAPAVLAAGFYFTKSDAPSLRAGVVFGGILSALIVVALDEFDEAETYGAIVITAGVLAGLLFFGRWWSIRQRIRSEEHFIGITIENQQRREAMREEFGTDVPDRDYVVDEE